MKTGMGAPCVYLAYNLRRLNRVITTRQTALQPAFG
jgi:hypothetical protein